ncbi:hypothetical protein [Staphylococcus epidermidis]|uniref:hypothetical protein n=1 Tax=Staphylococcus epidermidis TaxID=1282 RepID=UPI0011A8ED5C
MGEELREVGLYEGGEVVDGECIEMAGGEIRDDIGEGVNSTYDRGEKVKDEYGDAFYESV